MSISGFTREIVFLPAYDKRPRYGIHGVEMCWYLRGPKGVVQFVVYTNWMLPHVAKELDARHGDHLPCHPLPADLGYHSPVPMYEGQTILSEDCRLLNGPCYYDGSSLNAEPVFDLLVSEGHEAVWKRLEESYRHYFEEHA